MSLILLGILNSQTEGGVAQNHYVGISAFASGSRQAQSFTSNNRIVGFAQDGPSGDVGTIVQVDGAGVVLSANDIRTNVGGGDNRARVRVGATFFGEDYIAVTGEDTGNSDTHFIELAGDGTINWGRFLGRGAGGSNNVRPYDLTADTTGNVYGLVMDEVGDSVEIAKWNSSGTLQFKVAYKVTGFTLTSRSGGLSTDSSGNLYWYPSITDTSATAFGNIGGVIKLNPATGAIVFQKYFEFTSDAPRATGTSDSDGNSYATCRAQTGPGDFDNWALPIIKYNSSGVLQFETNLCLGVAENLDAIAKPVIDSLGNIIVAATVAGTTQGFLIYSVDSTGTINWQRIVTNSLGNRPNFPNLTTPLNIDANDNVFLGFGWNDGTNNEQGVLVFPASGDFIGTYTDGSKTFTVAASSAFDRGGFTEVTPAVSMATASSALTEGATTMQLFTRTYDLDILEA